MPIIPCSLCLLAPSAGMLGNLGPLPLDRIHNTLKMFASMGDHPCECIAGTPLYPLLLLCTITWWLLQ